MKILLIGGAGFIGRHVRRRLPSDADVEIVDFLEPRVHGEDAWKTPGDVCVTEAGALSPDDLEDIAPDVVIHLGAQVGVADSMEDPWRYLDDNTNDTLRFFEALHESRHRPRRLVMASSMSVYGDPGTEAPISETHPVRPASVYGLTKFDQEALALMYGDLLGISTCALRFWNVYGPEQALTNPYTGVLAIFARHLLAGKAPPVYEDGLQTRDFIYVEDVAEAVVRMASSDVEGVFNVSTGVATTVYDVAKRLRAALGVGKPPHVLHERRPGDIRHAIGDSTRLREALPGWSPRTFGEGLSDYAEWLKSLRLEDVEAP